MSSSINMTKSSLGMEFLKKTAGYVSGATGSYFKSAMPTIHSTLKEAKSTVNEVNSTLKSETKSISSIIRQLKIQPSVRNIFNWFLDKENEYASNDAGAGLEFDTVTDDIEKGSEISEFTLGSNQVSNSVIESTHKMVESQIVSTANIQSTLDKQTAVISAGFDENHKLLSNILEVLTKNTSTLIETSASNLYRSERENKISSNQKLLKDNKFDLETYKKNVKTNMMNNPILGMTASIFPYLKNVDSLKSFLSPDTLVPMGLEWALNKTSPNLKKNMKAIDDVVNDTIMSSLIRIGENGNSFTIKGQLSKIFGLDAKRKEIDTSRSKIELKEVPFDSITREYITNAIPGYLRKILVALGGNDEIYDARSRKFTSKRAIKKEYREESANTGTLYRASKRIKDKFDVYDEFDSMTYDLMMNDLGSKSGEGGDARNIISDFRNYEDGKKYILDVLYGGKLKGKDKQKAIAFAKKLSQLPEGYAEQDILLQASKGNLSRDTHMRNFLDELDDYNIDASFIKDSSKADASTIKKSYGRKDLVKDNLSDIHVDNNSEIHVSETSSNKKLLGLDYTNIALYEIYRRLNTGINVFRIGSSDLESKPFEKLKDLIKPWNYNGNTSKDRIITSRSPRRKQQSSSSNTEDNNLLLDDSEDIPEERELSKIKRVGKWGKQKGGKLIHAMFNGSEEDVRNAFGSMIKDIAEVGGEYGKKGLSSVNRSFGNISGHLQHKLFGTAYSYQDGVDPETGEPIIKHIAKNEKKGLFGFISDNIKETFSDAKGKAKNWLSDVINYFDYGNDSNKNKKEKGVRSKRSKILKSIIGGYVGMGILGPPMGLLVGGLTGAALDTVGIGDKIKDFLFGKDLATGKPTGILSKASDAIISPIRFQVGKTATYAASLVKKHILGPLSDIPIAIHDKIHNRIDGILDKVKSTVWGGIKGLGKGIGKGVASIAGGLATIGQRFSTTATGKLIRGAIGSVSSVIGLSQVGIANHIAGKRSFHKLKAGEIYPLLVGEKYRDPADNHNPIKVLGENNPRVKILENIDGKPLGVWLNGDRKNEYQPRTKDYLKWRRKSRQKEIDNDLARSGFFGSGKGVFGRVKGFFGGDYKKWHEEDLLKRQRRRAGMGDYTSERELTKEEVASMKATEKMAEDTSEIAKGMDQVTGEIIPGSSFKTHDQGIHDRLDEILSLFSKDKSNNKKSEQKSSIKNNTEDNSIVGSVLNASTTLTNTDDHMDAEEINIQRSIIESAGKDRSDKKSILSKLGQLVNLKGRKKKTEEGEKKESLFSKILKGIGSLPSLLKIGAAAAGLSLLLKNVDFEKVIPAIGKGVSTIADIGSRLFKWVTGKKYGDEDSVTSGMNAVSSFADVQAKSSWDYATPGSSLYHNERDAAGNRIENTSATEAKEELLWKMPLRQDVFNKKVYTKSSNKTFANARTWENRADRYASKSGFGNKVKSKISRKISDFEYKSGVYQDKVANAPKTNTASSVGKSMARIGVINGGARGIGYAAGLAASALGADENVSNTVNNLTTTTSSGLMTANMIYRNTVTPWKKSWVDKIVKGLKDMFSWLSKKLGAEKALKSIGSSKIATTITKMGTQVIDAIKNKIDDKIIKKIETRLATIGVKNASTVASAGLTIGVGAVAGLASGFCSTEHLFGVLPGEADAGMKTISSVLGAVFGALEMTPAGMIIALLDILDAILVAIPSIGKGIKQMLAQSLYQLFGGSSKLSEKQSAFQEEKNYYKNKFGVDMNDATFNDAVNNTGFFDKIIHGSVKKGADGHLKTDDAGGFLKTGGLKGFFVGSEKEYLKDQEGNVVLDEHNKPIQLVDKNGHKMKKDKKWGDYVGDFFGDIGKFFTGKNEKYKTDNNGNVLYDENHQPIKDDDGKTVTKSSVGKWVLTSATGPIGIAVQMAKEFKSATEEWENQENILDKDGNKIKDSKGRDVKKKSMKDFLLDSMNKVMLSITSPIKDLVSGANNIDKSTSSKNMVSNFGTTFTNGMMNGNGLIGSAIAGTVSMANSMLADRIGSPVDESPLSKNTKVTSSFGPRSELNGKFHKGVDLIPSDNSKHADVTSQYDGTIISVKDNVSDHDTGHPYKGTNPSGNMVKIRANDGSIIGNYHLKAGSIPSSIKVGSTVKAGQKIGSMGSTGHSTGEHLHYQVEKPDKYGNLIPVNPLKKGMIKNNRRRIGDPEGNSRLSSNRGNFQKWIAIIIDIKKQIANAGNGYRLGGNTMSLTSNGFTLTSRTDCSGFVQSCVSCLVKKNVSFSSGDLLGNNSQLTNAGFVKMSWPGWEGLYQGDIIAKSGHVEIFSHNEGSKHFVWNCGSDSSCNNPNPTPSAKSSYQVIWRLRDSNGSTIPIGSKSLESTISGMNSSTSLSSPGFSGFIDSITNLGYRFLNEITGNLFGFGNDGNAQSTINDSSNTSNFYNGNIESTNVGSGGAENLWKHLKKKGYNDIAISGILGCWSKESNLQSKRIEGDYLSSFPGYEAMMNDQSVMDKWVTEGLKKTPQKNPGYFINGHGYPGIGFAQWTRGRTKDLVDFAKSKGGSWFDSDIQLAFFDKELQNPYYKPSTPSELNKCTSTDQAVSQFCSNYEGYNQASGLSERKSVASSLYNTYKDKFEGSQAMGDPEDDDFMDYSIDQNNQSSMNRRIGSPSFKVKEQNFTTERKTHSNAKVNHYTPNTLGTVKFNPEISEDKSTLIYHKDDKQIIMLLTQVLQELKSITSNTGSSSDLLTALNQKDFVDKGLRESISAVSNRKTNQKYRLQSNPNSIHSIASMVRP